jgi:hypothetical protein
MGEEAEKRQIINQIKNAIARRNPEGGGVLFRRYKTQEVGIMCYHFEVIGEDGFFRGYYTYDQDIPNNELEIITAIMTEDLEEWEDEDEDELRAVLDFLVS